MQQAKRPNVYFSRPVITPGASDEAHTCKDIDACIVVSDLSPLAMVITSASPAFAASALQTLDPDKDGTVDLNEAKTAASALFDKLDDRS